MRRREGVLGRSAGLEWKHYSELGSLSEPTFELERGAPGQVSLSAGSLPSSIAPVSRFDLVDLLDPVQLSKFGLNNNSTNQDSNTLSEKWESIALVPLRDRTAPNDYLLLVIKASLEIFTPTIDSLPLTVNTY